ncbi:putative molybdenum carrier protein [Natronogracilivirgula saccharolytica]|uniref:Putative molybdenum carrier protein n=2 Tax=Natronogracilivirga saccharolytica TaxID=2812953 RepID=A0A8J7RU19_9BACT|nr:putative molybdenum carrier protein [Natronogracilivirga saccharolytica]MBP3193904.1 putative molybdenum carrier protein [Natronogracilivirga saccharolytica]
MLVKIISGAQTGADRAALDAALELGIPCGGWVPKGRYAEDGEIPERYPDLKETPDAEVEMRTEWNIRDSDATLIVSHGPLEGGSLYTKVKAGELGKPWLHLDLSGLSHDQAVTTARKWLEDVRPAVLNIAGSRASKDSDIYEKTVGLLRTLLPLVR